MTVSGLGDFGSVCRIVKSELYDVTYLFSEQKIYAKFLPSRA